MDMCTGVASASILSYPPKKRQTSPLLFSPCLLCPNGCPSQLRLSTCYQQHCAQRKAPVFKLLRGDFEVFRPTGATRCTHGGEIWHGVVDQCLSQGMELCQIAVIPVFMLIWLGSLHMLPVLQQLGDAYGF